MHLALIISSLGPGGAERVLIELAHHWIKKGHNVTLVTLSGEEDVPFYPLDEKVNLIRLGVMSSGQEGFTQRWAQIIRRVIRLRRSIKQLCPDRVLSFVDITNLTALLACVGFGVPVVVSERIDPHHHTIPYLYKALRRALYPLAHKVVVQTLSAARYFSFHVQVIPNFVRPVKACVEINPEVKRIVSVGRLSLQKDFPTLIMAFAKVYQQYPHMSLTIYGEGSERKKLEDLIDRENLGHCVNLPGAVTLIEAKLLEADLFVFPSLYEGFPNALCEAMAVGLPVIASNGSGNVDVVHDSLNGRLFPVGNVEILAAFMLELAADVRQRQDISRQARLSMGRFNQEEILNLWDEAVISE